MNFAIIGCGLIGQKRLRSFRGKHKLIIAADSVLGKAQKLAEQESARATTDWEAAVSHREIEAVMVATTNNFLAPVAIAALEAGKHVIVEKPAARNTAELRPVIEAAKRTGKRVQVGFNHR
jgi:predicted dehydrogenase